MFRLPAGAISNGMTLSTRQSMPEGGADMGGRGGSSHRQTAGGTAAIQTFLQNAYGANHANAVLAILQNAPAHIRALWEQYAAQFRATNMRRDEGAFYSPRDDSVHLHIPSVARGRCDINALQRIVPRIRAHDRLPDCPDSIGSGQLQCLFRSVSGYRLRMARRSFAADLPAALLGTNCKG